MRRHRPAAVVGLGGFVTGPGRGSRVADAPSAADPRTECDRGFYQSLPCASCARGARGLSRQLRRRHCRARPLAIRCARRSPRCRRRRSASPHAAAPIRLLVLGGSQGATRLNAVVPFALARLAASVPIEARHQAGERWLEPARQNYARRRRARHGAAVHRGHGRRLRVGGSGDLPRRCAHRIGARRLPASAPSSCRFRQPWTITKAPMPPISCARVRRC